MNQDAIPKSPLRKKKKKPEQNKALENMIEKQNKKSASTQSKMFF